MGVEPVGRHGRRITFLVMLLALAVVASGCIFLDTDRRNNFTGPSWDVDLLIPLVSETFELVEGIDEDLEDFKEIETELGRLEFELPPGWKGIPNLDLEELGDYELAADLDLKGVWDGLADVENEFDGAQITIDGVLRWQAVAPEGLEGEITLKLTGMGDKGEVEVVDTITLDGTTALSGEIDIKSFLDDRPETWKVQVGGELRGDGQTELSGVLALQFDLSLMLELEFTKETEFTLADPASVPIDSDLRERLKDLPLSDVELVLDMNPEPFAFTLALRFTDGDPDEDDDPAYLAVSVGLDDDESTLHDWQKVLEKLAGDDPYVEPIIQLEDANISLPPSVSVDAYLVIKADVNKR